MKCNASYSPDGNFLRNLHLFLVEHEDFYLVIHNIDGVMLRNDKAQTILSLMAKIRGFHIIASLDHINAPLCEYLLLEDKVYFFHSQ